MTLTVRGATIWRSLLNYAVGLCGVYFPFTYAYIQISMICVLLGLGQPKVRISFPKPYPILAEDLQDWPPLYGPISETYTLRRFWNKFWHQIARHMLVSYSQDLKSVFKIQRGTWLSSYSELYFCFFLSGLFHGISTYAMPYAPNFDFYTRFTMWFSFMFSQAFAIHLEDFAIWAYKTTFETSVSNDKSLHKGAQAWQMVVGYLWVYTFWFVINHWTMNPILRLGVAATNPLPFSLIGPILNFTGKDLLLT